MIQFDNSVCTGGYVHLPCTQRAISLGYKIVQYDHQNAKQYFPKIKLVVIKHVVSMGINKAILKKGVYLQKYS